MSSDQPSGNCYSAGEQRLMRWGQRVRQKMLAPVLRGMASVGISAQHLTGLSLLAGVLGAGAFYFSPAWGLIGVALHVVLDGIDGPLARITDTQSDRGSFDDTATDQLVLAAVTFVLVDMGWIDGVMGGVFVLLYTLVVGFAMIRNYMNIPYRFLFRPRFFYYGWIGLVWFGVAASVNDVLWVFNMLLAVPTITGCLQIRKRLKG